MLNKLRKLQNTTKCERLHTMFSPTIKVEDNTLHLCKKVTYIRNGKDVEEYTKASIQITDELYEYLTKLDSRVGSHTTCASFTEDKPYYSFFNTSLENISGCAKKLVNGEVHLYTSIDILINTAIDTNVIIYGTIINENDERIIEPLFEISGRDSRDAKLVKRLLEDDVFSKFNK